MATYVNNLRLKEIVTGAESGTWGTSTNTNLELIADAFGSGTEAITTDADTHTTTIADGSADEGRAIYMKYTGSLDSACTITLAPNTINKLWIIENATSGSQNIIISQGSGANITIGNGNVSAIFTDGAGSGAAVLDALADLELSATLTVAGAVTMSGDVSVGDDLTLVSDAAVLNFGENSDVSLTHVHDTGLLLNSTMQLQFNDSSQFINAPSATVLDINATDEIELNATAVDLNGTLDVSGTTTLAGLLSVDDTTQSTSTTTGSIHADGGLGVVKDAFFGGDVSLTGDFVSTGTGPHCLAGGGAQGNRAFTARGGYTSDGSSSTAAGWNFGMTITGASGDTGSIELCKIGGSVVTQTATEDIAVIATLSATEPEITDNLTGDITVASTVYIANAPTEGEINAALYVAAGDVMTAGGAYTMKEISTPTAVADWGRIYTKTDNKLYFQDGGGTEHEISFA